MPLQEFAPGLAIQGFTPPLRLSDFRLVAFDMDALLADVDCVGEIAEAIGMKEEVAAVTEAALRGEIDAAESLRRRVALLKGATVADLEHVYTGGMQLDPGAARLLQALKAAGLKTLMVSTGFTFFTDRIRDKLGIDFTRANLLEIRSGPNCGELSGRLADQPWGTLRDGGDKRRMLLETCAQLGISPRQAIALGRDAGDVPMLREAGLSVAWRAQPPLREQAMVAIDAGGPQRLLELVA